MKPPAFARLSTILIIVFLFAPLSRGYAQITYVQLQQNGALQLRQTNADGTGDAAVALPFTNFVLPTWSREGRFLALTASDPALPNQRGQNVFAIDSATGAVSQITFINDFFSATGNVIYTGPYYKAFSPDGSAVAVFSRQGLGGDAGTNTTTPVLEIWPVNGRTEPLQVHVDKGLNGKHHGGEGVDWSPVANVLVVPVQSSTAFLSGGGPGETTALVLMDPVAGAGVQGRFRQLTFPRADGTAGQGNGAFLWGEHDYQPKFSPNGRGVAYVRSFQNFNLLTSAAPDPDIQSIRIVDTTTGADREVIRFNPGFYITSLDWSPDGSQIVFDIGQQLSGPLGLQQQVNPQTVEIYIVNAADGSGLRRLRAAAAGTPAWRPLTRSATLGNISTRLRVGTGENALIGGFIVTGSEPKRVLLRALGPSLASANVSGALSDPHLELNGPAGVIATNDNWRQAPNVNEIPQGFAPADDRESLVISTLNPGSYTAIVTGAGGQTGTGLIEAYDLNSTGASRLANISTRGTVGAGDDPLIGGFIAVGASGSGSRVIVRAIGPSLASAGVGGALQNPTLELRDANGALLRQNNNWRDDQATEIAATGIAPKDDREAAIVQTLAPGAYTALVRGEEATTGIGLVEIYNLP